jgi:manganese transport protein
VPDRNSPLANVGGVVLLLVTGGLAANFVRSQAAGGVGPLAGVVLAFAVAIALAMVGLGGKFALEEVA